MQGDLDDNNVDPPQAADRKPLLLRKVPAPLMIVCLVVLVLLLFSPIIYQQVRQYRFEAEMERRAIEDFHARQDGEMHITITGPRGERYTKHVWYDPVLDDLDIQEVTAERIEQLAANEPDLFIRQNSDGWSFAHFAASAHRDDLVQIVIDRGGKVDLVNEDGQSPLHMIPDGWRLDYDQDAMLRTARLLLEAGADPNRRAPEVGSPVTKAARLPGESLLKLLVDHGGRYNQRDRPDVIRP